MARGVNEAIRLAARAGPIVARQLPKLWPLLLESRNRERVLDLVRDLASRSPGRRLRARVELTAVLADDVAAGADDDAERERAAEWARRARNVAHRLDMPVAGRQARAAHRQSVQQQLDALQTEMDAHLRG